MKFRMLDILRCPESGAQLSLQNAAVEDTQVESNLERPPCRVRCGYRQEGSDRQ